MQIKAVKFQVRKGTCEERINSIYQNIVIYMQLNI